MRVRLLLAAVCMLILPIFSSPSTDDKHINSAPFVTVAVAGHVLPGGRYCDCDGTSCSAGQGLQNRQLTSDQSFTDADTATLDKQIANGIDAGAGVMLLALTLLFGLRLRF